MPGPTGCSLDISGKGTYIILVNISSKVDGCFGCMWDVMLIAHIILQQQQKACLLDSSNHSAMLAQNCFLGWGYGSALAGDDRAITDVEKLYKIIKS